VADVQLWVSVGEDPPVPLCAGTDARLDDLDTRVAALEAVTPPVTAAYVDGGDAAVADGAATALADHAACTTGVHGIADFAQLATKATLPIAAADHGVVGDGICDDTAALQAAIDTAAVSQGAVTINGCARVTGTISVPDGVTVAGFGRLSTILVDAGFDFPVLLLDNVTATVRDLTVRKAPGVAAGPDGNAVRVVGDSDGARISDVTAEGMSSGFCIAGQLGTVPGTVCRVLFDRCTARNSNVFGFWVDECDGLELAHCSSVVSGLDGVKLRRKARNVVVTGGYYTGAVGGDGMDAFAGGDSFTIQGAVFSGNALNGLVIKCDDFNRDDPGTYGYVRTVNLTGIIAQNNGGSGIACHRSSGNPDDPTEPLVSGVNIVGGQLNGNGCYGLYLNARRVTVSGISAGRNGLDGVYLEPACCDVDLVGVHTAGNSVTTPGARDGIHIAGQRIRIVGGSSIGSDPDGATCDADLAAAPLTQRYGLRVEAATGVDVYGLRMLHNATGPLSDASGAVRWAGPAIGNYLTAGRYSVPAGMRSTLPMAANVEYAVPLHLAEPGTIVRLGVEIFAAGSVGTTIRLGVRADLQHLPGPVLAEGVVAGDAVALLETTVSAVVAQPGVVWLTATAQTTGAVLPTVRASTGPLFGVSIGSLAQALGGTPNGGYLTAASTPGVLPATYTISNRAGALPLVAVRG
jgi:hypothetical protein